MKSGTLLRLLLLLAFLGSCSRNPLGEDLNQPILNVSFSLVQSCTNTFNQDVPYSCQINTNQVVPGVVFSMDPILTTCTWASLNTTTGLITGTPNDNNVGNCQIVVGAAATPRSSPAMTYAVSVTNVAPTLTIADAAPILQDSVATVIANNAAVQSSEEGFGLYSLDNATTTLPRCFDNAISLSVDPNTGAVTYQPSAGYFGTCNIKVAFDDGNAVANSVVSDEFSIQVLDINDTPILSAIGPRSTFEDIPLAIPFTIADDNPMNCLTSMSAASSNPALVPVANIVFSGTAPNCIATITPTTNSTGVSNITFTVTDTGIPVLTTFETFAFTVNAVNDTPIISPIANQLTNEDTPFTINFTITDPDNVLSCATSLSASSVNTALIPVANIVFGGTVPNCTATITPTADANGSGSVTVTVTDTGIPVASATQTFTVTVSAVNDAPVMSSILPQTTNEDTPLVINFTINDVDSALNCTTSVSASSANAVLVPNANIVFAGTAPNCTATVSPVADLNGVANLTFTVTDGFLTDAKTFSFTVTPVNDAPIISSIANQTTPEDTPVVIGFTITDVDNILNCSTSMAAASTNTGVVPVANVVFGGTAPNCTATVSPTLNSSGVSNLTLTVTDAGTPVQSAATTFSFTVTSVNDAPAISSILNQTTSEDTPVVINFTITDVDNVMNCSTSMSAASTNTTVVPVANVVFGGTAPNCTATVNPAADANGVSNLTFIVTDTGVPVLSASSSFSFTVTPVNDAPILSAIGNQTAVENGFVTVNFTITDVDSLLLCTSANLSATSSNTALMPIANIVYGGAAPNCTATFTPTASTNGSSNISITVNDNGAPNLLDTQSFVLTVTPYNDPPVISAIVNQTTPEDTPLVINFTITDIDNTLNCATSMSAASTNTALIPVANVVFGGTAPNCTATVSPVANGFGVSSLTLTVSDTGIPIKTDFQTFNFTVTSVNDAPIISSVLNQTTPEDTPVVISFTISDVDDVLNCSTSMSAASTNTGVVPVANVVFGGTAPNCTATVTPAANSFGVSNLTLTVTDTGTPVLTASTAFSFTVNSVNDAPIISSFANQTTNEDTPVVIGFTISDVDDVVSCTTSMSATSTNTALIPVANVVFGGTAPNCTATVSPVADGFGVSNLTLTVTDTGTPVLTASTAFSFTVNSVNDAPIISAVANQTTPEDTPVVINFTISDVDNVLSCSTSMSAASTNTALIPLANVVFGGTAPNCTATVSPAANGFGISNLTLTVTDTGTPVLTASTAFSFTVTSVNDAPILSAIGNQTTNEDTPLAINFTITDVDDVLSCATSLTAGSSNIALVPVANVVFSGTVPNCTATVTPVSNAFGVSNLTITVTDTGTPVLTDFETFSFTVNSVNDAPILSAIGNQSTNEDTPLIINFTITDADDVLNCATSLSAASSNVALVPVANVVFGGTVPNCTATVTPVANGNGVSNLTITVTDTGTPVQTDFETFAFTVNGVNDAPILSAIGNQTTNEDTPLAINFTITDVDDVLSCATSLTAGSSNIALVPVANVVFSGTVPNCTATVTPVSNAFGVSNLTITVTDTGTPVLTDFETFSFTVNSVNDAPILSAIGNQSTNEDTPLIINFTITDADDVLSCTTSLTAGSSNIALVPVANVVFGGTVPNCTATVTPVTNGNGVSNLTFTVTDTGTPVQTDFETFAFTVNGVNDAPVISAIGPQSVNEDNSLVMNYTITDVDSVLSCTGSMSASSSNALLIDATTIIYGGTLPNCTATITPQLNQNGVVNLTIRVTDSGALFDQQTFAVTVNPVNDAPTISAIANQTVNEDTAVGPLAFTIGDVDSILLCTSANVTAVSSNTALIPDASILIGGTYPNCTVTATPVAEASGTATLTVTVNDNGTPNLLATSAFLVTVTAINDPPTISSVANQTINEETSTGALAFTIGDLETGGTLTCAGSVTASSANTTVIPNVNIVIGGTAPNCTVTVSPPVDQYGGPIAITLTVTDTGTPAPPQATPTVFNITVVNINDAPTISALADNSTNENVPYIVNFTINDSDNVLTCTGSITAGTTNATVLPVSGVVFSGTAPNCTATVTPGLNQFGVGTLTFTVTDGVLSAASSFVLTVIDVDQTPVISAISNITRPEDNSVTPTKVSTGYAIAFTITDSDSPLTCSGSVSATSSNTGLLPVANIVFTGTAPNCTATVTSVNNATGTTNIVFTVTDGNTSSTSAFSLTYTQVNDTPTMSGIANQTTNEDTAIVVNFTIADLEDTLTCNLGPPPAGSLIRQSTVLTLVPIANIVFGGTAPNCTATITPLLNATGSTTILLRVNDGVNAANTTVSFILTVSPVNDNPVISTISNTSFSVGVPTGINFTITDVDNSLNCVTGMSAVSSNTAVVPNANIVFSGTAPNCTATVTATSTGTTTITYTVSDGAGGSASTGNQVTGLTAGQEIVSQSLSTMTATANSSLNSKQSFVQVNETVTLTVTVRDPNNAVLSGGHYVVIQKSSGTSNGNIGSVVDNQDGTYTATFTATTAGTARTFQAYVDGYPLTSTMPKVTVSSLGPNCLSYRNVGSNVSGVYTLDSDGDAGSQPSFQAYCDMVTQGGGWTLAAVPRRGIMPFGETTGLLNPNTVTNARNANIWSSTSQFEFTRIRVSDGAAITNYSAVNLNRSESIANLLSTLSMYSQSHVIAGGTSANADITSSIGSTCFIFRGKSAAVAPWSDAADYVFMGFMGGAGCSTPLNLGNNWDRTQGAAQWLISGYDGLDSLAGPEENNNQVGRNSSGLDWTNQDSTTLIWFK